MRLKFLNYIYNVIQKITFKINFFLQKSLTGVYLKSCLQSNKL